MPPTFKSSEDDEAPKVISDILLDSKESSQDSDDSEDNQEEDEEPEDEFPSLASLRKRAANTRTRRHVPGNSTTGSLRNGFTFKATSLSDELFPVPAPFRQPTSSTKARTPKAKVLGDLEDVFFTPSSIVGQDTNVSKRITGNKKHKHHARQLSRDKFDGHSESPQKDKKKRKKKKHKKRAASILGLESNRIQSSTLDRQTAEESDASEGTTRMPSSTKGPVTSTNAEDVEALGQSAISQRPTRAAAESAKMSITEQIGPRKRRLNVPSSPTPTRKRAARGRGSTQRLWEVEKIIDSRKIKGKKTYLVKWVNWPTSANTWEPVDHLKNCQGKLDTFLASRAKLATSSVRKARRTRSTR